MMQHNQAASPATDSTRRTRRREQTTCLADLASTTGRPTSPTHSVTSAAAANHRRAHHTHGPDNDAHPCLLQELSLAQLPPCGRTMPIDTHPLSSTRPHTSLPALFVSSAHVTSSVASLALSTTCEPSLHTPTGIYVPTGIQTTYDVDEAAPHTAHREAALTSSCLPRHPRTRYAVAVPATTALAVVPPKAKRRLKPRVSHPHLPPSPVRPDTETTPFSGEAAVAACVDGRNVSFSSSASVSAEPKSPPVPPARTASGVSPLTQRSNGTALIVSKLSHDQTDLLEQQKTKEKEEEEEGNAKNCLDRVSHVAFSFAASSPSRNEVSGGTLRASMWSPPHLAVEMCATSSSAAAAAAVGASSVSGSSATASQPWCLQGAEPPPPHAPPRSHGSRSVSAQARPCDKDGGESMGVGQNAQKAANDKNADISSSRSSSSSSRSSSKTSRSRRTVCSSGCRCSRDSDTVSLCKVNSHSRPCQGGRDDHPSLLSVTSSSSSSCTSCSSSFSSSSASSSCSSSSRSTASPGGRVKRSFYLGGSPLDERGLFIAQNFRSLLAGRVDATWLAEDARIHEWDTAEGCWRCVETRVVINPEPFAHGNMRVCYHVMDMQRRTCQLVAKRYIREGVKRHQYYEDVAMYMVAAHWGRLYNTLDPPKKIKYVPAAVLELPQRRPRPLMFALEPMLVGTFCKHNNNYGFVARRSRWTPQAFSHFTYAASEGNVLIVDIQGVEDIYTDPQILTRDGVGYGRGNLGHKGIRRFMRSHRCNPVCRALGLPPLGGIDDASASLPPAAASVASAAPSALAAAAAGPRTRPSPVPPPTAASPAPTRNPILSATTATREATVVNSTRVLHESCTTTPTFPSTLHTPEFVMLMRHTHLPAKTFDELSGLDTYTAAPPTAVAIALQRTATTPPTCAVSSASHTCHAHRIDTHRCGGDALVTCLTPAVLTCAAYTNYHPASVHVSLPTTPPVLDSTHPAPRRCVTTRDGAADLKAVARAMMAHVHTTTPPPPPPTMTKRVTWRRRERLPALRAVHVEPPASLALKPWAAPAASNQYTQQSSPQLQECQGQRQDDNDEKDEQQQQQQQKQLPTRMSPWQPSAAWLHLPSAPILDQTYSMLYHTAPAHGSVAAVGVLHSSLPVPHARPRTTRTSPQMPSRQRAVHDTSANTAANSTKRALAECANANSSSATCGVCISNTHDSSSSDMLPPRLRPNSAL